MDLPRLFVAGCNAFGQFKNVEDDIILPFKEWNFESILDSSNSNNVSFFDVCSAWSYNAIAIDNQLYLTGCLGSKLGESKNFKFNSRIAAIACNDHLCLILLINKQLYKILISNLESISVNFLDVENAKMDSATKPAQNPETIEQIACGQTFCVAITNKNSIYAIPSKLYTFPKHYKIKKIVCGAEHTLILTSNGDIYAFGSSLRGQLGTGKLDEEEKPTLIEALAGIKIIDISAGGWHSAAVSAFGDLYMWGWNSNGQIGRPVYANAILTYKNGQTDIIEQKLSTVFATPEIINLFHPNKQENLGLESAVDSSIKEQEKEETMEPMENEFQVEKIFCGMRHTVILTKCGHLLISGWNAYGQLGFPSIHSNVVQFTELTSLQNCVKTVKCGNWSTIVFII